MKQRTLKTKKVSALHVLFLLPMVCCLAGPASAATSEGFLAGLRIGEQYVSNTAYAINGGESKMEFSLGPVVSVFAGYRLLDLRFEAEVSLHGHDIDSIKGGVLGGRNFSAVGDMQATSYMLNMYMDLMDFEKIAVYVGAGLGTTTVEFDGVRIAPGRQLVVGSDNVVTFQVMAGAEFMLTEQFGLDVMYSFLSADDPTIGGINIDYDCHTVQLGGRYYF